jgi:hypothetical protein
MVARQSKLCLISLIVLAGQTAGAQGLPEEIAARRAADALLETRINEEAAARMRDDAMLDARINAEALTRAQEIAALQGSGPGGGGGSGGAVSVDCGSGGSVSQALLARAARIIVRGTCTESVTIDRDGVTLQGEPGSAAGIHGADSGTDTVTVIGQRVTVEGLTISGGRNGLIGLGASNLNVRNVSVQSVGRIGITYANGSSGTIDGCTVHASGRHGIAIDAAQARLINCTVTRSTQIGVLVVNGGSAAIGFTDRFAAAGNTIQQNGTSGIQISMGAVATLAMNQITHNSGSGVGVSQARASIAGGNTIGSNAGGGAVIVSSRVILGDAGPSLPTTVNHITANGNLTQTGGVFAGVGSSVLIRDAQIVGNNGAGLLISLRSVGQMSGSAIQNNASDGVRLLLGSALLPLSTPAGSTISGNSGAGISCLDGESSVVNLGPPALSFSSNAGGDAPACTGF